MYRCINCNAQGVVRTGDKFQCPQCKYAWDVAHEQVNAAYLASQGRKPAEPAGELAAAALPEDDFMQELGLTPQDGAPDREEQWRSSGDEDDEPDDDEVDEAIVAALLHAALKGKTVPELEALADEVKLDLGGGNKPDKIQVLIDSQRIALVAGEVVVLADVKDAE